MTEDLLDEGIDSYATSAKYTEKEKLALRYSELMASDPDAIDDAFFAQLRQHYNDAELTELGSFIGFNVGYHTFFGTLKFYPMFSPDGRLVSQEDSQRIYGAEPGSLGSKEAAV